MSSTIQTLHSLCLRASVAITITAVCLFSCGKKLPTLDGVDLVSWKKDNNGCAGVRKGMIENVIAQKSKLLALNEVEIIKVLGRPDRNELFKRNQKFYYYFIDPSEKCQAAATNPKKLLVRFNAVGLAKEVVIE